jgi:hypothetical protein
MYCGFLLIAAADETLQLNMNCIDHAQCQDHRYHELCKVCMLTAVPMKLRIFVQTIVVLVVPYFTVLFVKITLKQAMGARGAVRRRGSHICSRQSAHRWR